MKILVATDGSKNSLVALDALVARLGWFREPPQIELFYAHPHVPYGAAAAWAGKEALHKYYEEESEAALAPARERLTSAGIAFEALKKVGDPAAEIVRQAAAAGCDLIVMGTHGHTALANVVMGSIATKVLASAHIPVLLLR